MEFKIYKSVVEVRQHFNADSLDLVIAGEYQFVSQKGIYQTGDVAIVIPEKAVLPPVIQEPFKNYLKGPEKNRVGGIRLRGEISQGILLNRVEAEKILGKSLDEFEFDADISDLLGITKYEAYIPPSMAGVQKRYSGEHHYFDCVQYGSQAHEFQDDEIVIVTEKVHGCCHEDTMILLKDGSQRTIRKICEDRMLLDILSYNVESKSVESDRIINHSVQENLNNWYEIKLEDGKILKLTENHLVLVEKSGGYVMVKDLKIGDILKCLN
jgi:RNA ligase (TIGR02306 family)